MFRAASTVLAHCLTCLLMQAALVGTAQACPVCDSPAGEQVRAGIADGNATLNLAAVLLPFLLTFALVAVIHGAGRRGQRVPPTSRSETQNGD